MAYRMFSFFGVLAVMMYLWKPNANSHRYAFSSQLDDRESGTEAQAVGKAAWTDVSIEDDDDAGDDFWSQTRGASAFDDEFEDDVEGDVKIA
mmetsp:Transcript_73728/g.196487  ORF Transcript_73728/g.196487 Transcript_73728/m.196487 type:complete len:92 (+) Transcript_73728:1265-1540(+)